MNTYEEGLPNSEATSEDGKHILFTPEEREKVKQRMIKFSQTESREERVIKEGRRNAHHTVLPSASGLGHIGRH